MNWTTKWKNCKRTQMIISFSLMTYHYPYRWIVTRRKVGSHSSRLNSFGNIQKHSECNLLCNVRNICKVVSKSNSVTTNKDGYIEQNLIYIFSTFNLHHKWIFAVTANFAKQYQNSFNTNDDYIGVCLFCVFFSAFVTFALIY